MTMTRKYVISNRNNEGVSLTPELKHTNENQYHKQKRADFFFNRTQCFPRKKVEIIIRDSVSQENINKIRTWSFMQV